MTQKTPFRAIRVVLTMLTLLTGGLVWPAHSTAAPTPGPVWASGSNGRGQLGSDTATGQTPFPKTVPAPVNGGIVGLAAGTEHSLALGQDGTLYAWGANGNGQLGTNTAEVVRQAPGAVANLTGVTAAAAGEKHSVAIANGALYAWGDNSQQQLGSAANATCSFSPCSRIPMAVEVAHPAGVTFTAIGAGTYHSLAVGSDGRVYSWGSNGSNRLGGSVIQSGTPVLLAAGGDFTGAVAVAGGDAHSVILRGDRTVWAWGYNVNGQVGDGTTGQRDHPVQVLSSVTAIAAGKDHTLALRDDGTVWAWGDNTLGQLGTGTVGTTGCRCIATPTQVPELTNVTVIGAGMNFSLAVKGDGKVWAWGANDSGQQGNGAPTANPTPRQVQGANGGGALTGVQLAVGGGRHSLFLTALPGPTSYALTVTANGPGTVAVSPDAGRYAPNTAVTLTPRPQGNALFTGWTVDGQATGWADPLTLTMNANRAVTATFANPPAFCDVAASDPYFSAIQQLAARGVIRGITQEDGSLCFAPTNQTLRAQMAALIARAVGWDLEDHGNGFSDRNGVDDNLWRNVGTLAHYAVARGYKPETCASFGVAAPCYGPTDSVLYAQVISFITRGLVQKGYWQAQPDNPTLYPNIPADSGHRQDIATYVHYAGALPGTDSTGTAWVAWDQPSTRTWFAEAEWRALDTYFRFQTAP